VLLKERIVGMSKVKYSGRVGYVGLGNMGAGIATRLVSVGMDVVVFDLRKEAVEELVAEGATGAGSLEELAAASDTVLLCVDTTNAVLAVVKELAEYLTPNHTVIIQSSVAPAVVFEAAQIVETTGAKLYDGPVSGSMEDRLNGTLSVLVGASEESVGAERALLEAMGQPLYFDALGGGEVAKLSNNAIMTVTRRAAAEVMAFAAAYGLSEDDVRRVAAISSGQSWVLDNWEYQNEQHRNGAVLRLGAKQVEGILAVAADKGVRMRMLEALREHGEEIDKERYRLLTGEDPSAVLG
jgi:3-hydroxyisobutyrate dehydrogenase-like beta-hydroxyacid dehydrogenase